VFRHLEPHNVDAQLEPFLLIEHGANSLELFAQFCRFVPCSKALKERAILAAGKLALDCVSQFIEDLPTHSRHNRNERTLQDVVIGARACAEIILSTAQCRCSTHSGISSLEKVFALLPFLPSRWSMRTGRSAKSLVRSMPPSPRFWKS
jgi:hypothetical protein